jgi:porin
MTFYVGKIHPNEFISLSLYNYDERSQFLNAQNDGNLRVWGSMDQIVVH